MEHFGLACADFGRALRINPGQEQVDLALVFFSRVHEQLTADHVRNDGNGFLRIFDTDPDSLTGRVQLREEAVDHVRRLIGVHVLQSDGVFPQLAALGWSSDVFEILDELLDFFDLLERTSHDHGVGGDIGLRRRRIDAFALLASAGEQLGDVVCHLAGVILGQWDRLGGSSRRILRRSVDLSDHLVHEGKDERRAHDDQRIRRRVGRHAETPERALIHAAQNQLPNHVLHLYLDFRRVSMHQRVELRHNLLTRLIHLGGQGRDLFVDRVRSQNDHLVRGLVRSDGDLSTPLGTLFEYDIEYRCNRFGVAQLDLDGLGFVLGRGTAFGQSDLLDDFIANVVRRADIDHTALRVAGDGNVALLVLARASEGILQRLGQGNGVGALHRDADHAGVRALLVQFLDDLDDALAGLFRSKDDDGVGGGQAGDLDIRELELLAAADLHQLFLHLRGQLGRRLALLTPAAALLCCAASPAAGLCSGPGVRDAQKLLQHGLDFVGVQPLKHNDRGLGRLLQCLDVNCVQRVDDLREQIGLGHNEEVVGALVRHDLDAHQLGGVGGLGVPAAEERLQHTHAPAHAARRRFGFRCRLGLFAKLLLPAALIGLLATALLRGDALAGLQRAVENVVQQGRRERHVDVPALVLANIRLGRPDLPHFVDDQVIGMFEARDFLRRAVDHQHAGLVVVVHSEFRPADLHGIGGVGFFLCLHLEPHETQGSLSRQYFQRVRILGAVVFLVALLAPYGSDEHECCKCC